MRLTASKLDLAHKCLYPWTSGLPWKEMYSAKASLGKGFHRLAEQRIKNEFHSIDSEVLMLPKAEGLRLRATWEHWLEWYNCNGFHLKHWGRVEKKAEVQFALKSDGTSIENAHGKERDYTWAPDDAITGTADLALVPITEETDDEPNNDKPFVAVGDWKTGMYVPPPQENSQIRFLSAVVAKAHNAKMATGIIWRCTPEGVQTVRHEFDRDALKAIEEESLNLIQLRKKGDAKPNPGPWGRFCPVQHACGEAIFGACGKGVNGG